MDDDTKNRESEMQPETPSPAASPAPQPQQAPSDKGVEAHGNHAKAAERLSDKDVFFRLLPGLCGSFATRYTDPKTVMALAVELSREETGRMADIGVCTRTTLCYDQRPLALQTYFQPPEQRSIQQQPAPAPTPNLHPHESLPLANTNGRGLQGQMVAHWETHSVQKIHGL
jgi:hypothetical protein